MIVDIYIRVSTKQQAKGDGLRRQEEICRKWCAEKGYDVRTVIVDVCSAYKGQNFSKGKLAKSFDSWRKFYWDKKDEPLDEEECSLDVVPELPPDLLIVESLDRFARLGLRELDFTLMLFYGIGIKVGFADLDLVYPELRNE
jgi:DNA invertase Pin-like site-specific DNA recombinase